MTEVSNISTYSVPNLCRNSVVLLAVLVTLTIALILSLVQPRAFSVEYFSLCSVYLSWLVLSSLGLLCVARKVINRRSQLFGYLSSIGIFLCVFTMTELISQYYFVPVNSAVQQFCQRGAAVLLAAVLAVIFFSLLNKLDRGAKSESHSKLQALQSRIRPHFLFNSLNTISELVAIAPDKAENAIQSLSVLFRATLDDANEQHTLKQELKLCSEYHNLEKLRLGERFRYRESVDVKKPERLYVPKLILQPLMENAILHGVSMLEDGGMVELDVRETRGYLSIKVSNSKPKDTLPSKGAGLAVDNIRERLFVLYDDDHYFKLRDEGDKYSVVMRFPKKTKRMIEH